MNELFSALAARIQSAQSILLLCHISPDGDTCGSALALRRALVSLDKKVAVCCEQPVPQIYRTLCGAGSVGVPDALRGQTFDLALSVDVSDEERMGTCAPLFHAAKYTAQIDHHGTNPGYAQLNLIRSPLSATGVLAAELIDALSVAFDREIAECLYVAVATDTGNFKQANTDVESLSLAARCVQYGFDVAAICRRVFDLRPACQIRLFAAALSSLEISCGGALATLAVSAEDFARCGASPEYTEGIVNLAFNIEGVRIAAFLSQRENKIKVSLRSTAPYDVAAVAARFGGGGHTLAAGCTLDTTLDQAREAITAACRMALCEQGETWTDS